MPSYSFDDFIAELRRITAVEADTVSIATTVQSTLARFLRSPDPIPEDFCKRPEGGSDTGYMLHRDKRFNVVSVVWGPGESVVPHNHSTWGAVGVLRNVVEETRYVQSGSHIEPGRVLRHGPGDTSILRPGDEIHSMHNPTAIDTVEIHVYGKDLVGLLRTKWNSAESPEILISDPYLNC